MLGVLPQRQALLSEAHAEGLAQTHAASVTATVSMSPCEPCLGDLVGYVLVIRQDILKRHTCVPNIKISSGVSH